MIVPQKILIASPRYLLKAGLFAFFESKGLEVLLVESTQDQLERSIMAHVPDYVLVDDFQDVFKIEKTIAFLSFTKPAKVIVVSDKIKGDRYAMLQKVGVRYFISSLVSELEMNACYEAFVKDERYIDQLTQERVNFNPEAAFKNTCAELNISEREVEIIKLIAEGYINKEIADQLFLSTHTVNTHRKNIMSKLGVSNATGIVIFAVKEKLISPKDFLFSSKH